MCGFYSCSGAPRAFPVPEQRGEVRSKPRKPKPEVVWSKRVLAEMWSRAKELGGSCSPVTPSSFVLQLLRDIPTPSSPSPTGHSHSFQPLRPQGELGFVGNMEKQRDAGERAQQSQRVWEVLLLFPNKWKSGIALTCGARGCGAGMIQLDLSRFGGLRSGLFPSLLQEGFVVPVHVFQKDEDLLMNQMESPALSQCVTILGWT